MKYDFRKIEAKWRGIWEKNRVYEPDFKKAKRPFYNLMMFPYPSAEGLHIGGVRTFTGVDIYGRLKRMQGYDVFEPIGLDGFGIHSENYALKTGKHPFEHAKQSEKNFYRQLGYIGNGFALEERLETYDPEYYKWTQWIFTEMFRRGLAYRKKQAVNWCPSCKTVLADEQVVKKPKAKSQKPKPQPEIKDSGNQEVINVCERCDTKVIKKELEQWFFRITAYADRLLKNLDDLDWPEPIKIAQRNWIGRSEGAELEFEISGKRRFVLLHGYRGSPGGSFFPWLRRELEKRGHTVAAPQLPGSESPNIREQVAYVKKHFKLDANTVLLGHSLGAVAALKVAESLPKPIAKLVLAGGFTKPKFEDHPRPFEKTFDWEFNFKKIKRNAPDIRILHDINDKIVSLARARELHTALGVEPILFEAESMHICGKREPAVLENCVDSIKVFTTRPDTLFGATYVVLAPEHKLIQNLKVKIQNWREVERYISKAKAKSEEERIAEGREKTGVELRGVKAINPATKKEIPVWVADYVLSGYGTGAIMAVPAHDERDWEFAKKYKLPIRRVIQPVYIQTTEPGTAAEIPGGGGAYAGEGVLVNSGKFNGMDSEKAKWEIAKSVGGERRVQYRLRDWLISRQRYWGPPIPIIYCRKCWEIQNSKLQAPNKFKTQNFKARAAIIDGKEYIIHPVPEKDLPVKLPYVKDFRPRGTGKSPLASVKSFYEARCPQCGGKARRETDVSDTFLDSAWYFLRYPSAREKKRPWNPEITKKWLPVHSYIGGAEHAVLHLLYSRFLAMAMKDAGHLRFEEPFSRFRTHGLITKDGAKMSKSRGNVVNPDEYFSRYGADAMRMYLAFLAPLTQGGDFRDEGIAGITRFLERVWRFGERMSAPGRPRESGKEILAALNRTIKKVGEDIEDLRYNTAISALMVLLSEMEAAPEKVSPGNWRDFCKLLAPFAPFLSEELWHAAGGSGSVHLEKWPVYNPKLFRAESVTIAVQVNGKVRDTLEAGVGASEEEVKRAALRSERVRKFLGGAEPKRIIYVPGRLINLVI